MSVNADYDNLKVWHKCGNAPINKKIKIDLNINVVVKRTEYFYSRLYTQTQILHLQKAQCPCRNPYRNRNIEAQMTERQVSRSQPLYPVPVVLHSLKLTTFRFFSFHLHLPHLPARKSRFCFQNFRRCVLYDGATCAHFFSTSTTLNWRNLPRRLCFSFEAPTRILKLVIACTYTCVNFLTQFCRADSTNI